MGEEETVSVEGYQKTAAAIDSLLEVDPSDPSVRDALVDSIQAALPTGLDAETRVTRTDKLVSSLTRLLEDVKKHQYKHQLQKVKVCKYIY